MLASTLHNIYRTEQPKQQKSKNHTKHSLFRAVQVVTGGEVWRWGVGSSCFTPAKGQNFPKASRYLFGSFQHSNCPLQNSSARNTEFIPKNTKAAFLLFIFRKLETLLL